MIEVLSAEAGAGPQDTDCVQCQLLRVQASLCGVGEGENRDICICILWRTTSWTNKLIGGPQIGAELSGGWRIPVISKRLMTVRCLWNKRVSAARVQQS